MGDIDRIFGHYAEGSARENDGLTASVKYFTDRAR
jgi:hypothetical protein